MYISHIRIPPPESGPHEPTPSLGPSEAVPGQVGSPPEEQAWVSPWPSPVGVTRVSIGLPLWEAQGEGSWEGGGAQTEDGPEQRPSPGAAETLGRLPCSQGVQVVGTSQWGGGQGCREGLTGKEPLGGQKGAGARRWDARVRWLRPH